MALSRDEFIRRSRDLMAKYDARIMRAWLESLDKMRDAIEQERLLSLLEQGRFPDAENLVTGNLVAESTGAFFLASRQAFVDAGDLAARGGGLAIEFNPFRNVAAQFISQYEASRVREIEQSIRTTISGIMRRNAASGVNPIETAREIRASIGLTDSQAQAVGNYRRYLQTGDRQALERALRDKRFDRSILSGKPLTAQQIDKMVERYRQRYVKFRAETIARTESTTIMNKANQLYWQQIREDYSIPDNLIRREWIYTHDGKVRDAHAAIPAMNKNGVGLNEPFRSPLGNIMYPGDPAASAGNRINCRCTTFTRVMTTDAI